jgi:hypothetical protein
MGDLGKLGVYIAGTTLPSEDRTDLYDIYADMDKGTVVVAEVMTRVQCTLVPPTHSPTLLTWSPLAQLYERILVISGVA